MIIYRRLILIFFLIACSKSETGILDDESVEFSVQHFSSVEKVYFPNLNQVINNLNLIIQNESLSKMCKQSLIKLRKGIRDREYWALSFYDSSSQGKSGLLSGLKADLGHFDQCLRSTSLIDQEIDQEIDQKEADFDGQFCMLSIRTNEYDLLVNQNPHLYKKTMSDLTVKNRKWYEYNLGNIAAVCIPSTCEIDRLLDIINSKLVNSNISIVSQAQCTKLIDLNNRTFSLMELISIVVLSSCVICVLIGTYYPNDDLWKHFDAVENSKKLFRKVSDPERLRYKSIHGFKFLYLLLSIMAHVWFVFMPLIPLLFGGNRNYDIGMPLFREISAGSLYLPDVMFLIGGLLTCVMWYPVFEKTKGKISFFSYVILRWFRVTPVILAILLIGFVYPRFGSGPFFNDLANHMQTNCKTNFWKNLLYVANFDRGLNMCLPQTWYLSCDFQLYILHYLTIYYLYKKPKIGLSIAGIQILLSCVYIFWSTFFNHLPGYLRINEITLLSIISTEYHYLNTLVHMNVYTIGVICGWLMVTKKNILKVKPSTDNLISLLSFSISLSIFFIPRYWINIDSKSILLALWSSVVRIIFVFYFVYAFYSYSFGGASYLRFIMTFDFQVPFSRMCLSIVVSQFIYILYYFGSRRNMISFTTFDQIKEGISAFTICSLAGYLLYLIVEAPFSNLLTHFATRKQRIKKDEFKKDEIKNSQFKNKELINDETTNLILNIIRKATIDEKKIN